MDSESSRSRSRTGSGYSSSSSDNNRHNKKSRKKVHKKHKTYKTKTQVDDYYLTLHWLMWSQREIFTDLMRAWNALREFESARGEKKVYRDIAINIFQAV